MNDRMITDMTTTGILHCATCAIDHPRGDDWSLDKVLAFIRDVNEGVTTYSKGDLVWFATHLTHDLTIHPLVK